MSATAQQLREAAEKAFSAGQYQQALAHSIRLERTDPDDPSWPRYTALICQAMGRQLDQIDALERAGERFARRGELLKAAAACKHILTMDPKHAGAQDRLAALRAAAPKRSTPARATLRPAPTPPTQWRGGGLQSVPLKEVMPGAKKMGDAGVYAIPLEENPERSSSFQLPEEVRAELNRSELSTGIQAPQVVGQRATENIERTAEDIAVEAVAAELMQAQRTEQALEDTTLFKEMPKDAFHDLIDRAELVQLRQHEHVFRQGAPGEALFVIVQGEVGVIDEGPPRRGLTKLGEGDFFGEMALVSDAPRSATCTALRDVELIGIRRPVMQAVLQNHPEVLTVLLRFFRDRSVDRLLRTNPIFSSLSPKDHLALRPFFRFLEVEAGAHLIRQGQQVESLIVLLAGKAEALGQDRRLGLLLPGDIAGEMSLLSGEPASATVRAIDKLFAVEFSAVAFKKIVQARPAVASYIKSLVAQRSQRR